MKLYLSGPIAGHPNFMKTFEGWTFQLEGAGYEVVNPTQVGACVPVGTEAPCLAIGPVDHPGDLHSRYCYLKHVLKAMLDCDGVALMPGHETSRGATLEAFLAMQVGMRVDSISKWLKAGHAALLGNPVLPPSGEVLL